MSTRAAARCPTGRRRSHPIARILARKTTLAALCAALVVVTGGRTARIVHAVAHGKSDGPRAGRVGATARSSSKLPALVIFECADALDDGTLVDERQADALAKLALGARWLAAEPPPTGARARGVRLYCGPDLDGDGDREALVELSYPVHEAAASGAGGAAADDRDDRSGGEAMSMDDAPAIYWLLVSKHGPAWRAIAGLGVDLGGGTVDSRRAATFVRRPGGRWGVEAERRGGPAQSGCRLVGYEIFELHTGVLRAVKAGDRSVACVPCGCDAP